MRLMATRQIENRLKPEMFEGTCLLCSEATPITVIGDWYANT